MFVREKRIGAYRYLYLVETIRENGRTKQRIIRNLGRKEMVEARGDLDRLARSAARLSQRSMILSLIEDGGAPRTLRVGASAPRCCSNGYGRRADATPWWRGCWPGAGSNSGSSAQCS